MMAGPSSSERPWSHIATTAEHGHCRKDASCEAVNGPHIPKWALIAAAIGATLSFGWLIYLTGQTDLPRWAKLAEALLFAWFVGRAWRQALQA